MSRFLLEFDFDVVPFEDQRHRDIRIANVLRKAADVIVQNSELDGVVVDMDGVIVGHYTLTNGASK